MVAIVQTDPSGWWLGELRGKRGLFPQNYCKLLFGDDEDSSYDSEEDSSLEWDSADDREAEKEGQSDSMLQVCRVCELVQEASLLCRQCGCALQDCPLLPREEYLRTSLLDSIRQASALSQLRKPKRRSLRPDSVDFVKAALEKTRVATAGCGDDGSDDEDDSAWDD